MLALLFIFFATFFKNALIISTKEFFQQIAGACIGT
jgi:hypothetical protein